METSLQQYASLRVMYIILSSSLYIYAIWSVCLVADVKLVHFVVFLSLRYQVCRINMAGLRLYKLDNGESFPTNCFPIRAFHQSKKGIGISIIMLYYAISYKYEHDRKFKNVEVNYISQ